MPVDPRGLKLSVLCIDDHQIFLDGLRSLLQKSMPSATIKVANSLAETRNLMAHSSFDIVFLDLILGDGNGLSFVKEILSQSRRTKVILMTGARITLDIEGFFSRGIDGLLSKAVSRQEYARSIQNVLANERYISKEFNYETIKEKNNAYLGLKPRLFEVLEGLHLGLQNQEIASKLSITEATVSYHMRQLRDALGASTNREILYLARQLGVLD